MVMLSAHVSQVGMCLSLLPASNQASHVFKEGMKIDGIDIAITLLFCNSP